MCSRISYLLFINICVLGSPTLLFSPSLLTSSSNKTFTGKTNFRATGHWKCLHSITQTHFSVRLTSSSTMFTFSGAPQKEVLHILRIWQARFGNMMLLVSSESSLPGKGAGCSSPHALMQTVRATVVLSI